MDHRIQASFYDVAGATPGRVRQVRSVGSGLATLAARLPAGQAMLLGAALNPDTEFVDGLDAEPVRAERPVLEIASGTVTVPEEALPVRVLAARQVVATWDAAGSYILDMDAELVELRPAWPYQWQEVAPMKGFREKQVARLRDETKKAITAGFQSTALGSVHWYPSTETAQLNLQRQVNRAARCGAGGHVRCTDTAGTYAMRWHTADQLLAVGDDLDDAIAAIRSAYAEGVGQVDDALAIGDVAEASRVSTTWVDALRARRTGTTNLD